MKILENNNNLSDFLENQRVKGPPIALIPTMGSIHLGHISLIEMANKLGFYTIVSIFVNPTQFNDLNDYHNYPKNIEKDIKLLEKANTKLLFLPSSKDLYPDGIKSKKLVLSYRNILCDKFRPGHFDGVTTVVNSLFNLINPDHAFFGEKDYQQFKLIKKMVENDNSPTHIHSGISIRMKNGMSLSSRYLNFNSLEKNLFNKTALILVKNINQLRNEIDDLYLDNIRKEFKKLNINKIDYLEIRDDKQLLPTDKKNYARLFIAYYINNIRIIDNFILY